MTEHVKASNLELSNNTDVAVEMMQRDEQQDQRWERLRSHDRDMQLSSKPDTSTRTGMEELTYLLVLT